MEKEKVIIFLFQQSTDKFSQKKKTVSFFVEKCLDGVALSDGHSQYA